MEERADRGRITDTPKHFLPKIFLLFIYQWMDSTENATMNWRKMHHNLNRHTYVIVVRSESLVNRINILKCGNSSV